MNTTMPTVILPAVPTACTYGDEISALHLILPNGNLRHFKGSSISGGFFSRIIASRKGIVKLLAAVLPEPLPENHYGSSYASLKDRGLFILPVDFKDTDWLVAVEEQMGGCDPGWAYHLLFGKLPAGAANVNELFVQLANAESLMKSSGGTMPFEQFQLWPVAPATT